MGPKNHLHFLILLNIIRNFSLNTVSRNSLNRGINYIAERWESIDAEQDTYTLAIVTYALHQSNHPQKDGAFRLLDSVAKTNKEGKKWWGKSLEEFEKENPWNSAPSSVNIQMTSYGLLTIISRIGERGGSSDEDALPVLEWLLQQQNSNGGNSITYVYAKKLKSLKSQGNNRNRYRKVISNFYRFCLNN